MPSPTHGDYLVLLLFDPRSSARIRGKALDFPDGAHVGGDPYPLPSPGIPRLAWVSGGIIPRHPRLAWVSEESCGTAALGGVTRFAYTLPPPPPIRILKHLCDFVPGCPRLARVCQPLWPFASCTCFRVVKDPSNTPLFRSGTNLQLYHLFAILSREKHAALALREFPSMPPPFG
jgi:hypothetical protein